MSKKIKYREFKCILYPTDFSRPAEEAFDYAASVAKASGAKLYILHVVETGTDAAGFYLPHISFEKIEDDMMEAASRMLSDSFSKRIEELPNAEAVVLRGVVHTEITKFAKKKKVDLVVMGTSGRSGIDRMVFGSTTERVLRELKCPVLAIPPK